MKVLFIVPQLHFSGTAQQLTLLARALPRDQFDPRMLILGKISSYGEVLRQANVPCQALAWTRSLDLQPLWRLRRLIRDFDPDLLHVSGLAALRIVQWVRGNRPVMLGDPIPAGRRQRRFNRLDCWLLNRVERILVKTPSEGRLCRSLGLAAHKIALIPPAVDFRPAPHIDRPSFLRAISIPASAQILLCLGPVEPHKGFRDGIWALDILKYLFDDLHMVLLGDGSDRSRLERFAHAIRVNDRVHFVGIQKEIAPWLAVGNIVWIPSVVAAGAHAALAAMAAAKPVAASRLPELVDILGDSPDACWFSPGDKVGLARQTRILLKDADLRQRMGEALQWRAVEQFTISSMVGHYVQLTSTIATTKKYLGFSTFPKGLLLAE